MLTIPRLTSLLVAALDTSEAQIVQMIGALQDAALLTAEPDAPLGTDDSVTVALALVANVDANRIVEHEADASGWH